MTGAGTPAATSVDVAIIGGGPAGTTVATLLKLYRPALEVLVLERERFPREHVGESQLPSISPILDEMGIWHTVEAAGFPIKIGASYTWGQGKGGKDPERWDFDFYPVEEWVDEPRPADYAGQRRYSAFQVERAHYDQILMDRARELGATVLEETQVKTVEVAQGRIEGLILGDGARVQARHYVDATGVAATGRRALGIESWQPKELRNIAIWDYWDNADWAVEIGVGATRVQVRSLPYGWIWFIPLGPTRTSIGLICPSAYYKQCGKTPERLYHESLAAQPDIAKLIENASADGQIHSCKDWSHLAETLADENWFIVGESAGFAEPIQAAGLSLAHSSAREAAYSILELERGELERDWIIARYNTRNRHNIGQHIKFAQYWYAANGCFTDLQDHCRAIAKEAGLNLTPRRAWQWLSQGGFTTEQLGLATFGSFDIASAKQILQQFDGESRDCGMLTDGYNVFKLNLSGAKEDFVGHLVKGRIERVACYRKGKRRLPRAGYYRTITEILEQTKDGETIVRVLQKRIQSDVPAANRTLVMSCCMQVLEAMVQEGWVKASLNRKRPVLKVSLAGSRHVRASAAAEKAIAEAGRADLVRSRI